MASTEQKVDPAELQASLEAWVATTLTLTELVPNASIAELVAYAEGVISSPVAARVLAVAMAPAPVPAPEKVVAARPLGRR